MLSVSHCRFLQLRHVGELHVVHSRAWASSSWKMLCSTPHHRIPHMECMKMGYTVHPCTPQTIATYIGFLIQKIIVHPGIWDPNQSGPNKFHDIPFGIVWFGWVEDKSGISGTSSMLHAAFFSSQAKYFTEPSGKSRQNSFRILATSDKINGNFLCPLSHQTNLELSSLPTRRSISSKLLISQLRWQLHSPCSNPGSSFSMDMYVSMQLGNGCRVQRPKDVSQCEVRGRRLVIKSRIYW